jgi:hypothetical protein
MDSDITMVVSTEQALKLGRGSFVALNPTGALALWQCSIRYRKPFPPFNKNPPTAYAFMPISSDPDFPLGELINILYH